jgi:glycosidase
MMFDFELMQNMYLSLARQDAGAVAATLRRRPPIPDDSQWVCFARNHDELTLDQLTADEREEVFAAFGPEERMQVYGRGLKRRLPPMLSGDLRRIKLVYSLIFSLPGTPALYYGEEIGMGENLEAERRLAVRTPMQWAPGRNGGFSMADPARLPCAVVDGEFGPENVNVEDAKKDPDSLLHFMTRLTWLYRECPELAWGRLEVLDQPVPSVLLHSCTWEGATVLLAHNLGADPVVVPLSLPAEEPGTEMLDLFREHRSVLDEESATHCELDGYGFAWLRLRRPTPRDGVLPDVTTAVPRRKDRS